jgi:hypothetical protein
MIRSFLFFPLRFDQIKRDQDADSDRCFAIRCKSTGLRLRWFEFTPAHVVDRWEFTTR